MAYSVAALKLLKPRYAAAIMLTHYRFLVLIAVLGSVLASCGQRGPLYLPDESAPPAVPAQASQPTEAQAPARPDPLDTGLDDENPGDEEDPEDEPADDL